MTEAQWLASNDPAAILKFLPEVWALRTEFDFPSPAAARKLRLFACGCCRQPEVWGRLTDDAPCGRCGGSGRQKPFATGFESAGRINDWLRKQPCSGCSGSGRVNRSREAVVTAERFADGEAKWGEVVPYNALMEELQQRRWVEVPGHNEPGVTQDKEWSALCWAAVAVTRDVFNGGQDMGTGLDGNAAVLNQTVSPAIQATLLRCIFGNPWQRLTTEKPSGKHEVVGYIDRWLAWNDGVIRKLAEMIYAERAFDRMPMLADALETAGCTDADILNHCRGRRRCGKCLNQVRDKEEERCRAAAGKVFIPNLWPVICVTCKGSGWVDAGSHVRGCWVLDTLLNKL